MFSLSYLLLFAFHQWQACYIQHFCCNIAFSEWMKNKNDCLHVSSPGGVCLSIHLPNILSVHACILGLESWVLRISCCVSDELNGCWYSLIKCCSGDWWSSGWSSLRHLGGHVYCVSNAQEGWRLICSGWTETISNCQFIHKKFKSWILCLKRAGRMQRVLK